MENWISKKKIIR